MSADPFVVLIGALVVVPYALMVVVWFKRHFFGPRNPFERRVR